jgi:large subunit ribosomal protein L14e
VIYISLLVGRVCVKTVGREQGRQCVIIDVIDKSYVLVTGPKDLTGIKRRRVNLKHLILTDRHIDIGRGASDSEVLEFFKKSD